MAKWAYQYVPHDAQDYDGVNENVLLDLKIDGKMRKVMVHAARSGYMYVQDRLNGKVISAEAYVPVNAFKGVDLKTGKPKINHEKIPAVGKVVKNICPAAPGGKDWQPMAYSPRTGYLYVPSNNLCMDEEYAEVGYIAGTPYVGAEVAMKAGPGGHRGIFQAWDPVKNQRVWQIKEKFPAWSGALATAGDVVFYGTMDRWFKAVDAKTGKLLWKFRTPSGVNGQPITFEADGKQYVAVLTGVGGWSGAVVSGGLDTTIPYGALGFVNAVKDLPDYTAEGGTLMVFELPDSVAQQKTKSKASQEQGMK
jgi:PQQ-dependent dehydrogenase (methanol/ethanol family)